MFRGRKRISFGTIAMVVFTTIVLVCTFAVIVNIRSGESNLSMDAERLVSSIAELMEISQPERAADSMVNINVVTAIPQTTGVLPAATAATAASQTPVNETAPLATTPSPASRRSLSMTISGVISFDEKVVAGAKNRETGTYTLTETLEGLSSAIHAQMNIALLNNLPGASADEYETPQLYAQALRDVGFDYVLLNADCTLEAGENGVRSALDAFAAHGIAATGLYAPESAKTLAMYRVNNLDIAMLAYTDVLSAASKTAVRDARMRSQLTNLYDQQQAVADVQTAKRMGADIILVSLHWGASASTSPTTAQRAAVQALCNAGADIIICAHSDMAQPVELLSASDDPAHRALVAWSMGTLLSESRASREVVSGLLLHLEMSYDESNHQLSFDQVQYTPTYVWGQKDDSTAV